MVHAKLGIAAENSGKLVALVRQKAREIAKETGQSLILIDGPPGIGCPVIASITGTDLVLVVTEPTLSGKHDLDRVIELTKHFMIPTAICINNCNINPDIAKEIRNSAHSQDLKIAGEISYDPAVTKAQIAGQSIVEYSNGRLKDQIASLWKSVLKTCKENTKGEKAQ